MRLILFIITSNATLIFSMLLLDRLMGWLHAGYVSDYFFYAFLLQLLAGAFLAISPPPRLRYMKHTESRATNIAASMLGQTEEQKQNGFSSANLGLGSKMILSAFVALVITFLV